MIITSTIIDKDISELTWIPDRAPEPETCVLDKMAFWAAFYSLSDGQRVVLSLLATDYSYTEIAQQLGIENLATVRKRAERARIAFSEALKRQGVYGVG